MTIGTPARGKKPNHHQPCKGRRARVFRVVTRSPFFSERFHNDPSDFICQCSHLGVIDAAADKPQRALWTTRYRASAQSPCRSCRPRAVWRWFRRGRLCEGRWTLCDLRLRPAILVGAEGAKCQALNLDLPQGWNTFAPVGHRRLINPQGIGKCLLRTEVLQCLFLSHGGDYQTTVLRCQEKFFADFTNNA